MTQLPRLVNEIIGWYQWKIKIEEVNRDYSRRIDYDSQYGWYNGDRRLKVEEDTFHLFDRLRYNNHKAMVMKVHYRKWGEY
jgi:hypothetical protein